MLAAIDKHVKNLIAEVDLKIKNKSDNVVHSKKWTFGTTEVTVRLYKQQWTTLLQILGAKHDNTKTEEERRKGLSGFAPRDSGRPVYWLPLALRWSTSKSQIRESIIDSSNPLDGWSRQSILSTTNQQRTAKNDLNGLLYFHVRSTIERFCNRLQDSDSKTRIIFYCIDAVVLPKLLPNETCRAGFDRIEVSNIADEAYLGLRKTLATFAPLLKNKSNNPHAALLTLFLNACEIADRNMGNETNMKVVRARIDQVTKYLPLKHWHRQADGQLDMIKMMVAKELVRDYDGIFAWYMDAVGFETYAKEAGIGEKGVKMKRHNSITEAWPMRLKKKAGEKGADEEFQRLMAANSVGAERYVEWVRKE
ncbi:MAG: hypothetical protein Q9182_002301 [Xanthomendoza sp. 2 TL-2023]